MWHRSKSLKRFMPSLLAAWCKTIDSDHPPIDCVFWCMWCNKTIALAEDCWREDKQTTVMESLAKDADKPAFLIRFTPSVAPNPAFVEYQDIESFVVTQLVPERRRPMRQTPQEHADWIIGIRYRHWVECSNADPEGFRRLQLELSAAT